MADRTLIPTFEEWQEKQKQSSQDSKRSKRALLEAYNPANEQLPDCKFFKLDRGAIDEGFNSISAVVLDTLTRARPEDKQLVALQSLARDLQKVTIPETLDVAMVGEQAMGKSLAINALQHRAKLSKTSASGGACTASAIRFCHKPDAPINSDSFDAKIKFMDDEDLTETIQEHIDHYFHFHFSGSVDEETFYEAQRAAADAEDFFNLIHNSEHDRKAASQLKSLLTDNSITDKALLNATITMAHTRIEQTRPQWATNEERTIVFKDQTIEQLMKDVEQYMAMCPFKSSLWPIMQSLDILMSSVLTKHGVHLRDLPGLSDENQIRTATTNAFRRKAGYGMIFARADRVTTDSSVNRNLRQSIRAHGAKGTILILTKKDEYLLDTNSVEDVVQNRTTEPFSIIRTFLGENMDKSLQLLEDDDNDGVEYENRQAYEAHLENIAKLAFIEDRAKGVAEEMSFKFKDLDPNPIRVFSISASMYLDSIRNRRSKRPLMSPEQTGIPRVRRYLLELCAGANLKVFEDHAFEKMDSLLEKCRRITDVEKKHEGYALLRTDFTKAVTEMRKKLRQIFNCFIREGIEKVFNNENLKKGLQNELMEVVEEWADRSRWNTYQACLIRKGIGRSRAAKYKNAENPTGAYNWNEDQGKVVIEDMDDWRERMKDPVCALAGQLQEAIMSGCQDIGACIQASSLPPNLRIEAVKEWEECKKKVTAVQTYKQLSCALKLTHQYATTETDIRCMNAKLNADYYMRVYDFRGHGIVSQKRMMRDLMHSADHNGRLLIDRIEQAVSEKSRADLKCAFEKLLTIIVDKMMTFDEHLKDRGPLDYKLTEADRQLRVDVLGRIPELERMVEDVCAKFNDDMLLGEQAVPTPNETEEGEAAQKKIKVEMEID